MVIGETRPLALGAKALTYAEDAAEARKTAKENFIVYYKYSIVGIEDLVMNFVLI